MTQTRKDFLKNLGIVTIGACCGAALLSLSGCSSVRSVNGTIENQKILIKKSEFAEEKNLIVNHSPHPIFLNKVSDTEYTAVLMLCTHKNCELNPSGSILVCPCHGSEFSKTGKVLEGPASADLIKYIVKIEGDNLIINL